MKKLLSILAAVGLTATASTAVVACGSSQSNTDPAGNKETDINTKIGENNSVDFTLKLKFQKGAWFKSPYENYCYFEGLSATETEVKDIEVWLGTYKPGDTFSMNHNDNKLLHFDGKVKATDLSGKLARVEDDQYKLTQDATFDVEYEEKLKNPDNAKSIKISVLEVTVPVSKDDEDNPVTKVNNVLSVVTVDMTK